MDTVIRDILTARRTAAEQRAARDAERALALPEFVEAEKQVRLLSERAALDAGQIDAYREAVARRDAVLAAHGLCVDPQYTCPLCSDTGFVDGRECSCTRALGAQLTRERFDITVDPSITFARSDFARFGEKEADGQALYAKMQAFCDAFDTTRINNIVIGGLAGVGKTHLACCVYNELLSRGVACLCCSAFALDRVFVDRHTGHDPDDRFDAVLRAEFLVIDDLGTEPLYRNVTLEYLFSLLNERMLHRRRTLITTNLTPEQLYARYRERVMSRLLHKTESCSFVLHGDDRRLQAKRG